MRLPLEGWVLPGLERVSGPVLTRRFALGRTPVTLNVADNLHRTSITRVVEAVQVDGTIPALLAEARVAPRAFRRGRRAELRLELARPAQVDATIQRRTRRGWRTMAQPVRPLPAGSVVVPLRRALTTRLPRGRYRALVEARDDYAVMTSTARFRVLPRRR